MLLRVLSITHIHISTTRISSAATCLAQTCPTATLIATQTCSRICISSQLLAVRQMFLTRRTRTAICRMSRARYHLKLIALAKTLLVVSQQKQNAVKILIART